LSRRVDSSKALDGGRDREAPRGVLGAGDAAVLAAPTAGRDRGMVLVPALRAHDGISRCRQGSVSNRAQPINPMCQSRFKRSPIYQPCVDPSVNPSSNGAPPMIQALAAALLLHVRRSEGIEAAAGGNKRSGKLDIGSVCLSSAGASSSPLMSSTLVHS